jgi:hypothetical protein
MIRPRDEDADAAGAAPSPTIHPHRLYRLSTYAPIPVLGVIGGCLPRM